MAFASSKIDLNAIFGNILSPFLYANFKDSPDCLPPPLFNFYDPLGLLDSESWPVVIDPLARILLFTQVTPSSLPFPTSYLLRGCLACVCAMSSQAHLPPGQRKALALCQLRED